jgi:hypothetical protein
MPARLAIVALLIAVPSFAQCIAPPNFAASQGSNCSGVQVVWGDH